MNRYLVTRSGAFVGTRTRAALLLFGPMIAAILLGIAGGIVGSLVDSGAVVGLAMLGAFGLFVGAAVGQWIFLLGGATDTRRAFDLLMTGDTASAVALCQKPLGRVFRADIRTRALHVLGLAAEANGDFAEAADLFDRAAQSMPAFAANKWARHARVLMLSHRAIALVATGRLEEADAAVRIASGSYPQLPPGALDALTDDAAFGAMGVNAALRDLEPGRDPRAVLTLASIVFLAARGMGREAVELSMREKWVLDRGLLPRERALLAIVESRAHAQLGGSPMRAQGIVAAPVDPSSAAWAERILPPLR